MTKYITHALVLMTAVLAVACTITDTEAPPLAGPSEMSLSLVMTANPDVLSLDGSSQTLIIVEARDENGQPRANVPLRVEIIVDNQLIDFGTISARTLVTGSNGRATFTYTAPSFISGVIPDLQLSVTPTGQDAAAHIRRVISVRLVAPGTLNSAPTALFTFAPPNPAAFSDVRFDGSTSTGGLGAVVTNYVWDFGDNTSGTGVIATHQYALAGTYLARLTVTDSNGISSQSAPQTVTVGGGAGPTAAIIFNPSSPTIGQTVFFNGNTSTAGAGHRIVRWDWNFGDGSSRSGSSVTRAYTIAGTYTVVLTVTDEVGQTAQATASVTVGTSPATAVFTFSPTDPQVGTRVNFNASASKGEGTNSIRTYAWDFGDGTTGTGVTPNHTYTSAVNFNGSGSKGEGSNTISRYVWDFGCTAGVTCTTATVSSSSPTTSTVFVVARTYTVRLTITDSRGRTATTTQDVTIAP